MRIFDFELGYSIRSGCQTIFIKTCSNSVVFAWCKFLEGFAGRCVISKDAYDFFFAIAGAVTCNVVLEIISQIDSTVFFRSFLYSEFLELSL